MAALRNFNALGLWNNAENSLQSVQLDNAVLRSSKAVIDRAPQTSEDGVSALSVFSFLYAMKPDAPLPLARRSV